MTWIIPILLVALLLFFLIASDELGSIAWGIICLILLLCIAGIVIAYIYGRVTGSERREISKKIVTDIELINDSVRPGAVKNNYIFRSNVKNNSEYNVEKLEISFSIRDCPVSDRRPTNNECVVIGEYVATEYVTIPAGQVRAIDVNIHFIDTPDIEGAWSIQYFVRYVGVK